jgi:CRISPR-associated protein Cmr1
MHLWGSVKKEPKMTTELLIKLRTLTPLWTGGVETGMSNRIHETGLIGSLRWWYEAIVRGVGGKACDAANSNCDAKNQCKACELFGTTGWQRRFRLEVTSMDGEPAWEGARTINFRPYGRHRGWYLPAGWVGTLTLQLVGDAEALAKMATLFLFLEQSGGIGAKQHLGYGAFRVENRQEVELKKAKQFQTIQNEKMETLPDLRAFTFFQARFEPHKPSWWTQIDGIRQVRERSDQWRHLTHLAERGMVPVSPTLKNYWRFQQKWPSPGIEQWLFGTLQRDRRMRSKVSLGWAIEGNSWIVRGWVWLPRDQQSQHAYASIVSLVRNLIENRSGWLKALNLEGAVKELQIISKSGQEILKEYFS